jgi:hypothetical protein
VLPVFAAVTENVTTVPAVVTDAGDAVFVTVRAGFGGTAGTLTVDEQFGEHPVSDVPVGGVTVAVFDSVPVVAAGTVPVTVYVTVPLDGIVTVSVMFPDPLAVHEAPADAAHVHVNPAPASAVGRGSDTVAPTAVADGAGFLTTTVYVSGDPATYPVRFAVLTTARLTTGVPNVTFALPGGLRPLIVVMLPGPLTYVLVVAEVTFTLIVQDVTPEAMVPDGTEIEVLPATAVIVVLVQVVDAAGVGATTSPAGNASVNFQPAFDARSVVLVTVNVSTDVPPTATLVGLNDLSSWGVPSRIRTLSKAPSLPDEPALAFVTLYP